MSPKYDAAFADGLALYVRTYSRMRAADDQMMTVEEIIGGLVSVIVTAIGQIEDGQYRARLVEATHRSLADCIARRGVPTSEAIN